MLLSPDCNGLVVALSGSPFGLLTAPTHALQNVPDTGYSVVNTKMLLNHLGDSLQCPQLGGITILASSFQEQLLQLALLFVG